MIETLHINSGAAVGADGAATANATSTHAVLGRLLGAYVQYNDDPPNTTDVTIETVGTGALPALTLLTLSNLEADGYFPIRHKLKDEAGADITFDGTNEAYGEVVLADLVKVTIAGANAGDNVDVTLVYEAGR